MIHTQIINQLIKQYNFKSYCEIGTFNREHNFNKIECEFKYCIDPDPNAKADFIGTSDEFFRCIGITVNGEEMYLIKGYDLYFIDGLHTAIQVYKDINNALLWLHKGGIIVVHDLIPTSKKSNEVPRVQRDFSGDCWMAFVWLRATRTDLTMYTLNTDYGIGIIQKGQQELLDIQENITYENFEKNKVKWLNIVSGDYLK